MQLIAQDVRTEGRERRDPAANLYAETCFTLMKITDEGGKPLARKPLRNRKCRADHSDGHSPLSCIRSGGGVTPPVLTHEKGGKGGKGGKCVGLCEPFLSCAHKKTFRLAAGARPAGRQDVGLRPSLRPRFGLDCGLRPSLRPGLGLDFGLGETFSLVPTTKTAQVGRVARCP